MHEPVRFGSQRCKNPDILLLCNEDIVLFLHSSLRGVDGNLNMQFKVGVCVFRKPGYIQISVSAAVQTMPSGNRGMFSQVLLPGVH